VHTLLVPENRQHVGINHYKSTKLLTIIVFRLFSYQVIFSQSSELLERHSSRASSTEEVSAPDVSIPSDSRKEREDNADHFGTVFKDFDFLEYESESVEVCTCCYKF
jgi:hypothetical protein